MNDIHTYKHMNRYLFVRYSREHILLISVNIVCISYKLPVSGDPDRLLGPPIHIGTDTGQKRTKSGYEQ